MLRHSRYSPKSVRKADALLWQRVEPVLSNLNRSASHVNSSAINNNHNHTAPFLFDVISFNIVMLGWSRQASSQGAEQAHVWLHRLWQLAPRVMADEYSYCAVLNAHAQARSVAHAQAAQHLLHQILARSSWNNQKPPSDRLHNAVLNAWADSGHAQAGLKARAVLRQLQAHPVLHPTVVSYNTCLKAYAKTPGQAPEAQALLQEMKQHTGSSVQPNRVSYTTCIHAWAQTLKQAQQEQIETSSSSSSSWSSSNSLSSSSNRALQAHCVRQIRSLLHELEDLYHQTHDETLRPDWYTYTSVLAAQAIPPLEVWNRMTRQQHHHQGVVRPNAAFLNTILYLLGQALEKRQEHSRTNNNSNRNASSTTTSCSTTAEIAETLLRQMQHQSYYEPPSTTNTTSTTRTVASSTTSTTTKDHAAVDQTRPCKVTYTSVMAVWAHCGTVEAAIRAEQLLDELQGLWEETRHVKYLPTAKSFGSVLTAWNKAAAAASLDGSSSQQDKEQIAAWQRHANKTCTESFTILEHCLELEQRMHKLYLSTQSPELAPHTIIFFQLFQLIASTRDPLAALRAKQLLEQMNDYATNQGHVQVRPDSNVMATFLNALTKTGVGNVVELAQHILEQVEEGYRNGMGHFKPTSLLYSAVLQAYAKSASRQGASQAQALLDHTKQLYKQGKIYAKPTVLFYNAVMDAYARSNAGAPAAERAEALLFEMMRKAEAGDPSLQPTTRSFNAAILAWKNARVSDGPLRAESLLRIMQERNDTACRPDLVTYNSLVGAWATSRHAHAPQRAQTLLDLLEEQTMAGGVVGLQPDRITYNSCIQAWARRGAANEATALVERMMQWRSRDGYRPVHPDDTTLTSVRLAWSRCRPLDDDAAEQELQRVERLIRNSMQQQPATNDPS